MKKARVPPERRFNNGLQTIPSGRNAFPVCRGNRFYKTISQSVPELWSDFSERGLPHEHPEQPRRDPDITQGGPFRDRKNQTGSSFHSSRSSPSKAPAFSPAQQCLYVGFAEWDMEGRLHTTGEMDRLMAVAAASKYPCARPATFEEYASLQIRGIPKDNGSGRDVAFVGPGSSVDPSHANTLGSMKWVVPARDPFDGTATTSATFGRKCCLCVYPAARVEKQHSLTQFGLARSAAGPNGELRRARSWGGLMDGTQWAAADFSGSSGEAQRTVRYDRFFW